MQDMRIDVEADGYRCMPLHGGLSEDFSARTNYLWEQIHLDFEQIVQVQGIYRDHIGSELTVY
jgi:hypothetical protein